MTADNPEPAQTAVGAATTEPDRLTTRQHLRRQRAQISADTASQLSRSVTVNILPLLGNAQRIGGYLAFGNEVSIDALMAQCRALGHTTCVPLIQQDHTLVFAPVNDSTVIVQNKYGIREPARESARGHAREPAVDADTCLPATSLDIVIVPLLGFDPQCNRMGMGGGYYDRTFAHKRMDLNGEAASVAPLLIGAAFELQQVDNVFPDWWDVPLDYVVTEKQVYSRSQTAQQAHCGPDGSHQRW